MRLLDHNPKSIAIIGMGPSITDYMTETLTQEFKPDFADEIWAINMSANMIWHDLVFWMDDLDQQEAFRPGLFSCMRRRGKPVITSKAYPEIVPNSYDYPIDEIGALALPVWGKVYLNNGVAQAIAYAIWKDVKLIKLYGCDFSYPNRDYAESGRACVEAWVTLACEKNITVQLCNNTSLFDAVEDKGIYGYRTQPDIHLPDGQVFRFQKQKPSNYNPEDSSGAINDDISPSLPGAGSADAAGPGSPAGNGLDLVEASATPRPGEGLRDQGEA